MPSFPAGTTTGMSLLKASWINPLMASQFFGTRVGLLYLSADVCGNKMTDLRLRSLEMMSSRALAKEKWMSAIVREDFMMMRCEFLETPENQP